MNVIFMKRVISIGFACAVMMFGGTVLAEPPAISALKPGDALPSGYRFISLPRVAANKFAFVDEAGTTVLKVDSHDSAGSVGIALGADPTKTPMLTWRWKTSNVIEKANMDVKSGDDFSGRVYVFFDVPLASLPFSDRMKIRLARSMSGADVPTAALCYVWDNKHPAGFSLKSPYTNRVGVIVAQTGARDVNQWVTETHDVARDFREQFGTEPPRILGVAIGNDTDQTNDKVTTWFGDIKFQAK
jgi:Protein of unknown function (DUF3047)